MGGKGRAGRGRAPWPSGAGLTDAAALFRSGARRARHQRRRGQWSLHGGREGRAGVPGQPRQLPRVHPLWPPPAVLQREADAGLHVPLVSQGGPGVARAQVCGALRGLSPQALRHRVTAVT